METGAIPPVSAGTCPSVTLSQDSAPVKLVILVQPVVISAQINPMDLGACCHVSAWTMAPGHVIMSMDHVTVMRHGWENSAT